MFSPTADIDSCRKLLNDFVSILELMCESGLIVEDEYGVKEYVSENNKRTVLMMYYTLVTDAICSREDEVKGLREYAVQVAKMCANLCPSYFDGGYEIKVLKVIDYDAREVVDVISD